MSIYGSEHRDVPSATDAGMTRVRRDNARDIAMLCIIALLISTPLNLIAERAASSNVQLNDPGVPASGGPATAEHLLLACFLVVGALAVLGTLIAMVLPATPNGQRMRRILRYAIIVGALTPFATLPIGFILS